MDRSSGGGLGGRGAEAGYRETIHFNFILNIIFIVPRTRTVAKIRILHCVEEIKR